MTTLAWPALADGKLSEATVAWTVDAAGCAATVTRPFSLDPPSLA